MLSHTATTKMPSIFSNHHAAAANTDVKQISIESACLSSIHQATEADSDVVQVRTESAYLSFVTTTESTESSGTFTFLLCRSNTPCVTGSGDT